MITLRQARDLAQQLLKDRVPRRWEHSLGVLRRAESLGPVLGTDAELLAVSAILHDVGYAPNAVATGQHMIDGARYLADVVGIEPLICSVIAYHSSSRWEAAELGLAEELSRFEPPPQLLEDAITWCDLSTTPDGGEVDPVDRLDEVLSRYGPGHVVFRAVTAARPSMLASIDRIRALQNGAGAVTVRVTGWRPGLRKVSLDRLLHERFGMSMHQAKSTVDRILDNDIVSPVVPPGMTVLTAQ